MVGHASNPGKVLDVLATPVAFQSGMISDDFSLRTVVDGMSSCCRTVGMSQVPGQIVMMPF